MATHDILILDDVFEVIQKDPDGKKFDRGVQRHLYCHLLFAQLQAVCGQCLLAFYGYMMLNRSYREPRSHRQANVAGGLGPAALLPQYPGSFAVVSSLSSI